MKNLVLLLAIILSVSFSISCSSSVSDETLADDSPDPSDIDGDGIPNTTDIDYDGDGLIEIADVAALNNIRYNLAGTSYDDEENDDAGNEGDILGCGGLDNIMVCSGYELVANITLPAATGTPAKNWDPVGDITSLFTATLEGGDFTINGLVINSDSPETGFVGGLSGTIKNLNFRGGSVKSGYSPPNLKRGAVGAVVAILAGGVLDSVSSDLAVTSTGATRIQVGGLVGGNLGATGSIINSYATGNVSKNGGSSNYVGGLIGYSNAISIKNSYATGDINSDDRDGILGGLVGSSDNSGASIENSYATGTVVGGDSGDTLGGLVGKYSGKIRNSYSASDVVGGLGEDTLGGLVGDLKGSVQSSYSRGSITGDSGEDTLGGLIGILQLQASVTDSYSVSTIDGGTNVDSVGALAGSQVVGATISSSYYSNEINLPVNNPIPPDTLLSTGTSKTAAELKSLGAGLVFSRNNWAFEAGKYPTLRSYEYNAQYLSQSEGEILCGQDTDFAACVVTTPDRTIGDTDGDGTNDDTDTDDDGDSVLDGDDVDDDGDGLIEIATFAELNKIRQNLAGTSYAGNSSGCGGQNGITVCSGYELVADITLPTATGTPAKNWNPVGDASEPFSATFDGDSYTINGLIINGDIRYAGFIGILSGKIANLNLSGGSVTSTADDSFIGAAVGRIIIDGSLDYVSSDLPITSISSTTARIGGLVGGDSIKVSSRREINHSFATGNVIKNGDESCTGGLIGESSHTEIKGSYATGDVTVSGGSNRVGGLVGFFANTRIKNSYAKGTVSGGNGNDNLGGLVGRAGSGTNIDNVYATGNVIGWEGEDVLGGLIGYQEGRLSKSYSIGEILGKEGYDLVGYLVGVGAGTIVTASTFYQSGQTVALDNAGSYTDDSVLALGTDQTDSELRALSATDLDANNWTFEADKYPTLRSYKLNNDSTPAQGDTICNQKPVADYAQCSL